MEKRKLPVGWYSQFEYSNGRIELWLESTDPEECDLPSFTSWKDGKELQKARKDERIVINT